MAAKMHVVYSCDAGFFEPFMVSAASLMSNSQVPVGIVAAVSGVPDEEKQRFGAYARSLGHEVQWAEQPDYRRLLGREPDVGRYSSAMFTRFCMGSMLPESVTRAVYLDSDTLVLGDIGEMARLPLGGKTLGAVNDSRSVRYCRNLGIEGIPYVNSGVLLFDLQKYRQNACEERAFKWLDRLDGCLEFPDNDLLCKVFQQDIALLPLRFNVYSTIAVTESLEQLKLLRKPQLLVGDEEYRRAQERPVIIHFTRNFMVDGRPWQPGCNHPFAAHYRRYRGLLEDEGLVLPMEQGADASCLAGASKKSRLWNADDPLAMRLACFLHSFAKPNLQWFKMHRCRKRYE